MKVLKALAIAAITSTTIIACNQQDEKTETLDLKDNQETTTPDATQTPEDNGNSIDVNVKADDKGNVEGELNGDVKLKDQ